MAQTTPVDRQSIIREYKNPTGVLKVTLKRAAANIPHCLLILFLIIGHAVPGLAQGVFRFPLFWVPTSLDPVKDELISTYSVVQQVYDGLVAFDSNLRVVPGLAESWTVSKDGKQYIFNLRKGVRFHNGQEVTPRDVVASLERLFDLTSVPSTREYLKTIRGAREYSEGKTENMSGIKVISETKIGIELTEPYAPFLSVLAMPITKVVPAAMAKAPQAPLGKHPVGTGPFRFTQWTKDEIILEANQDYFRGAPKLKEVRFRFYPGEERDKAFPDFLEGKLDGCPLPWNADPPELRKQGYQVLIRPRISLMFYGMNTRKPPLDDPELRRALSLALNREALSKDIMGSMYPPAYQIIPPGMPGYSPENALAVYDMEKARQHLSKSKYPGGKGLPELVLASVSHSDLAKRELEMYKQELASLGITLKPIFVENWEIFKKGLEEGRYDLFRYAYYADIPDPDDLLPPIVETGASHNFTGYGKPEIDALIEKARGETDPLKRLSLYREAERRVLEDPPLVPVIFLSTQVAFQKNVRNIDLPATGTTYLPLRKIIMASSP